jgi:hypothetical protein
MSIEFSERNINISILDDVVEACVNIIMVTLTPFISDYNTTSLLVINLLNAEGLIIKCGL